ncbi:MAG TPA: EamA family transporter RarD [Gemmataceae bacterium]|nr:EamA family transporter RarD [Gemmataceae bacterium]
MGAEASSTVRTGVLYGAAAYGMWGLVPLYFNAVKACPPWELVAHRIVWSAVLLAGILTAFGRWPDARAAFRSRKTVLMLLASAYLVAGNWLVYVWSATHDQVTQASLGYFILPLVNAFAGVVLFRERMRVGQGVALGIAAIGVGYLAVSGGEFPAIALTLAVSFALYGIVRKIVPVDGVIGLSVETFLLAPVALGFLVAWESVVGMTFGHGNRQLDLLIALSGAVTTAPLVCFAQAVRKVSLVTLGVLQYLSPTLQLVVAILVNGEAFGVERQISFGIIWCGLAVFAADAVVFAARRHLDRPAAEPVPEPIDGGLPVTDSGFTRPA